MEDAVELAGRPVAEEGDGDVELLARNGTNTVEVGALPRLDDVEHVLRQTQCDEEAQALICAHASGAGHTASSGL